MIIFDNASLLKYSHKNNFLGEDLSYGVEKNISVRGNLLDLKNFYGVSGIVSGIFAAQSLAGTTQQIIINGINFGSGYISNIDVEKGDWVRTAPYKAEIKISTTGNLYNMTGLFFTGDLSFLKDNLYRIGKSFSEDYTSSVDDGNFKYDHSLSFSFDSPLDYEVAISVGKQLAKQIIGKELMFAITSGKNNFLNGKKYYEESYDVVNKKFSFKESFEKNLSGNNANVDYGYNVNVNEQGIATVRESAEIFGLVENRLDNTISEYNSIKNGAYSRCQNIYSKYLTGALISRASSSGIVYNRFKPSIKFETTFSNNIYDSVEYGWDLKITPKYQQVDNIDIDVSLQIEGNGKIGTDIKYNNAVAGFYNISGQVFNKVSSAYQDFYQNRINKIDSLFDNNNLYIRNYNISSSKYGGKIGYNVFYTTLPNTGFISERVNSPVPIYTDYYINNSITRQKHSQNTLKEKSNVITRKLNKNYGIFDWGSFVAQSCNNCNQNQIQIDLSANVLTETRSIIDETFTL